MVEASSSDTHPRSSPRRASVPAFSGRYAPTGGLLYRNEHRVPSRRSAV